MKAIFKGSRKVPNGQELEVVQAEESKFDENGHPTTPPRLRVKVGSKLIWETKKKVEKIL